MTSILLDSRFPAGTRRLTDEDLDRLTGDFIRAARLAHDAGFQFVDIKHCHGYLGHELLSTAGPAGMVVRSKTAPGSSGP